MFFQQGAEQVAVLRGTDTGRALGGCVCGWKEGGGKQKEGGVCGCMSVRPPPVLFVNGSKDHRDSEEKWVRLCVGEGGGGKEGESKKSKLIVYEGADHFFSHDDRYVDRFEEDSWMWIKEVCGWGRSEGVRE